MKVRGKMISYQNTKNEKLYELLTTQISVKEYSQVKLNQIIRSYLKVMNRTFDEKRILT